ncbi:MAG: hypothetical protein GY792_18315 [Gammaproteobacteria bacterium]|nr:hypothetical protein [Gammaproteobacteria bacterium]
MKKTSVKQAALVVFRQENHPLHYKDLTKKILTMCDLKGKTPHESVRALIGTDERFKRVAEGVYALSEWEEYPAVRFAKDIAYDILSKRGTSMNIIQLGLEILEERKFIGPPKVIARNATKNDERFTYNPKTEMVGLRNGNK